MIKLLKLLGQSRSVQACPIRRSTAKEPDAPAGLKPNRIIYIETGDEKTALACLEEVLRHGGLGVAIADVSKLTMTASRRLQLAAEGGNDRYRRPPLAPAD